MKIYRSAKNKPCVKLMVEFRYTLDDIARILICVGFDSDRVEKTSKAKIEKEVRSALHGKGDGVDDDYEERFADYEEADSLFSSVREAVYKKYGETP